MAKMEENYIVKKFKRFEFPDISTVKHSVIWNMQSLSIVLEVLSLRLHLTIALI